MSALLSRSFLDEPTRTYDEFLREKVAFDRSFGFEVTDDMLPAVLKPHQAAGAARQQRRLARHLREVRPRQERHATRDPQPRSRARPVRRRRKLGRRGRAAELNPTSFRDAVMYQRDLDQKQATPTLFDLLDMEEA